MVVALITTAPDLPSSDPGSDSGTGTGSGSPHSGTWNVFELVAGQCFVKPAGAGTDGVTDVRLVDCAEPHYGEVFGRAPSDEKSYPGRAGVIADATKGCNDALLGFAPDGWKLPVAVEVHFFHPEEHAWALQGTGRRSTCFLTDTTDRPAGSLQQDLARFDADQMAYLGAEHRVDQAFAMQPRAESADDPAAFRAWADTLAGGVRLEIGELSAHAWGGAASRPVAALAEELHKALPHLAAAKDAKDTKTLQNELAATEYLGYDRPKAVRAALRLGTDDSRVNRSDGSGDTRTDGPAPVLAPGTGRRSPCGRAAVRPCGSEHTPPGRRPEAAMSHHGSSTTTTVPPSRRPGHRRGCSPMGLAGRARMPIDGRAVARSRRRRTPAAELFRGSFTAEEEIGRRLLRELPPEARYVSFNSHRGRATGADLLWWWVEPDGRGFGCLIQSRTLTHHAGVWRIGSDRRADADSQLTRLLYTAEHFDVPAALLLHPGCDEAADARADAEEGATADPVADDRRPCTEAAALLPAFAVRAELRLRAAEAETAGLRFGGLDGPGLLESAVPFAPLLAPGAEPRPPVATDADLARQGVHRRLRPLLTEPQSGAGAVARSVLDSLSRSRPCAARSADGTTLLDSPGRLPQFDHGALLRHVSAGLRPAVPGYVDRALAGHGPARLARYVAGLVVVPL